MPPCLPAAWKPVQSARSQRSELATAPHISTPRRGTQVATNLRRQLRAKEDELISLGSVHTATKASLEKRVGELDARASKLAEHNRQLETRRHMDMVGVALQTYVTIVGTRVLCVYVCGRGSMCVHDTDPCHMQASPACPAIAQNQQAAHPPCHCRRVLLPTSPTCARCSLQLSASCTRCAWWKGVRPERVGACVETGVWGKECKVEKPRLGEGCETGS